MMVERRHPEDATSLAEFSFRVLEIQPLQYHGNGFRKEDSPQGREQELLFDKDTERPDRTAKRE